MSTPQKLPIRVYYLYQQPFPAQQPLARFQHPADAITFVDAMIAKGHPVYMVDSSSYEVYPDTQPAPKTPPSPPPPSIK